MTMASLCLPIDVIESRKEITPLRGFSACQALLKSYIGEGLRQDEERYAFGPAARLLEAMRRRGVPQDVLDTAARDLARPEPEAVRPVS